MMATKELTIAAGRLKAGDVIKVAGITVESVQLFAGLVIVDFTDKTATPPIPQNVAVVVIRKFHSEKK